MNKEFLNLKNEITLTKAKLEADIIELQQICPHENILYSKGYTEYQGYDRDYIAGSAMCKDCELFAFEDCDRQTYKKLEKLYLQNEFNKSN